MSDISDSVAQSGGKLPPAGSIDVSKTSDLGTRHQIV